MKLIDADLLKDGIEEARAEFRVNFENGQINHKMYVIITHILDVFEETIDVMPEHKLKVKEGDK